MNLHQERLDSGNALEIFEPYDLILDGTDNFATRYLVNDACVLLGKPYVWGSIYRFEGQASVFWAEPKGGTQEGVQYRDLYPEPPPPGMVPSCAEGGVLGVLCASIGSIMVTEAIKLITGIGETLLGRLMVYDALEMTYRTVKIRRDPAGEPITGLIDYEAFCGSISDEAADAVSGHTISARDLKTKIDNGDNFLLVDVREQNEYEIVSIPGSVLIPKGDILSGEALASLADGQAIGPALQVRRALGGGTGRPAQGRLRRCRARRRRRAGLGQAGRPEPAVVLTDRLNRSIDRGWSGGRSGARLSW